LPTAAAIIDAIIATMAVIESPPTLVRRKNVGGRAARVQLTATAVAAANPPAESRTRRGCRCFPAKVMEHAYYRNIVGQQACDVVEPRSRPPLKSLVYFKATGIAGAPHTIFQPTEIISMLTSAVPSSGGDPARSVDAGNWSNGASFWKNTWL